MLVHISTPRRQDPAGTSRRGRRRWDIPALLLLASIGLPNCLLTGCDADWRVVNGHDAMHVDRPDAGGRGTNTRMYAPKLPPVADLVAPLDTGLTESVRLDTPDSLALQPDGLVTAPEEPTVVDTSDTLENGLKGAVAPRPIDTRRPILPTSRNGGGDENAPVSKKLSTDILQHDKLDQSEFDPNSSRLKRNPFAAPAGALGDLQRQQEWRARHGTAYNPTAGDSENAGAETKDKYSAPDDDNQ